VVYPTVSVWIEVSTYDDGYTDAGWKTVDKFSKIKITDLIGNLPEAPSYIPGVESAWYVYVWDEQECRYVCAGKTEDYIVDGTYTDIEIRALPKGYVPVEIIYPVEEDGFISENIAREWVSESVDPVDYVTEKYGSLCTNQLGRITFYKDSTVVEWSPLIDYKAERAYIELRGSLIQQRDDGKLYQDSVLLSKEFYDLDRLPTLEQVKDLLENIIETDVPGAEFQNWYVDEDTIAEELEEAEENGGIFSFAAYAQYDKEVVVGAYFAENEYCWYEIDEYVAFYPTGTSEDTIVADLLKQAPDNYTNWRCDEIYEARSLRKVFTFKTDGTQVPNTSTGTTPEDKEETAKTEVTTGEDGKIAVNSTVSFDNTFTITENGKSRLSDAAVTVVTDSIKDTVEEAASQTSKGLVATPTVKVIMADATVIPTEILNAAKGQDVNVEFIMTDDNGQEYSWTINGKSIIDANLKDVNLKVNKGTSNIPSAIVNSTVGNQPAVQLNLEDHGLFGFTADLHTYVGKEYAGQYANLYYYTNGRLEIQYSCVIDTDGYTTLRFTHASDYLVAIGEKPATEQNTAPVSGTTSSSGETIPTANQSINNSPDTGDVSGTGLWVMIFMAGCIAFAGAKGYRRKRA
jgi:hypothetical protein